MATTASPALPEFQRYQYAFTAHIRDPRGEPRPNGVEARRMNIYSALLYNNLEGFLLACFPVLRRMLGTRRWTRLVHAFFRTHRCHTPYFRQIPDEFIQFLQNNWTPSDAYPPYLLELAHYEWIELALSVSTKSLDIVIDADGDLLTQCPVLNPVLANLHYAWPVQTIRLRARVRPADTWLLVFRDAADAIQFSEINAFSARLIALIEAGTMTGDDALLCIARESRHPDPQLVIDGGLAILNDLRGRGAIVGVTRSA
jgi:hypothetical protein